MHDRAYGTAAQGALHVLEDGAIAIFRGTPDADAAGAGKVGPVYQAGRRGRLAVPTGRVLVRFRDGVLAEGRRAEIAAAGYHVDQVLPYAPQAAWVRRTQGDIATAIEHANELRQLPDVEHVEPEMLSPRVAREAPRTVPRKVVPPKE
jgi:hypothetical protein